MYNPLIIIIPILSLYYPYMIPILSLYYPYIIPIFPIYIYIYIIIPINGGDIPYH